MMNNSTDDKGTIRSKLESNNNNNNNNNDDDNEKLSKALARAASSSSTTTTTTSRQWAGFKNPRIVRVSRTFGGKDRHSKVCTIRGLRDRRIRLSVPTAVQLYDLQDRLGLSQPSKVVDWLLDATKLDIDKLPPLQIPQGSFVDFHQQSLFGQLANSSSMTTAPPHHFTPYLDANLALMKEGPSNDTSSAIMLSNKEGININDDVDEDEDEDEEDPANLETMNKWNRKSSTSEEDQYPRGGTHGNASGQVSAQSFFPMPGNNGFYPGLMNSAGMPYSNMYHWDPSNLSLAQFGTHASSSLPSQTEDPHHLSNNNYSCGGGGGGGGGGGAHQLFFCPPLATTSLFPQHDNRFHLPNSSLSHFHSSGSGQRDFVPHDLHPGENNAGHQDKGHDN